MSEEKKEMFENISEEKADDVSGGAIFYAGRHAGDHDHKWEVIDDQTGNVLGRYGSKKQALLEAEEKGSSTDRYYKMNTIYKKRDAWKQRNKYKNVEQSDNNFFNPF